MLAGLLSLGALGILGGPAWAMQNIKCIPADRKRRDAWTAEARPVLDSAQRALSAAEAGTPPGDGFLEKLGTLASYTEEVGRSVESEELQATLAAVAAGLKGAAADLKKAEGARAAITPLRDVISLLREHT